MESARESRKAGIMSSTYMPPESLAARGQLIAPRGKFRVVLVDRFEGPFADITLGDFRSLKRAMWMAKKHSGAMLCTYVYNDRGELMASFGTP